MIKSLKNNHLNAMKFYLQERRLWWRHAGWFTFAHKPLCNHYQYDTIRLRSYRVCRSCALVYSSFFVTLLASLVFYPLTPTLGWATLVLIGVMTIVSYPPLYRYHARPLRDILRSALGTVIALTFSLWISELYGFAISATLILLGLWLLFGQVRQSTKRSKCTDCPEFGRNKICTGYAAQSKSIQAYETALEGLVKARSKSLPSVVQRALRNGNN